MSSGLRVAISANSSPEKSPVHSPTSHVSQTFSPKDIHEWLNSMGVAFVQYGKNFEDNGMSLDFLVSGGVTDQDLEAVGVSALHRKRILYEIEQEKFRREGLLKRGDEDESPASDAEEDPAVNQVPGHVPVLVIDETHEGTPPSGVPKPTPPPPPDMAELPPPPPDDEGRVFPPPPG